LRFKALREAEIERTPFWIPRPRFAPAPQGSQRRDREGKPRAPAQLDNDDGAVLCSHPNGAGTGRPRTALGSSGGPSRTRV